MAEFTDRFWTSADGLKLHYRDYPATTPSGAARPPVVCLHGLTRNARDFAALADRLAGDWRVLCPDLRGRGDSDYARDAASYKPRHYIDDLMRLLEAAGIDRFVAIGTSLGGLLTMAIAMIAPERIAGAVLNDIGPTLEPGGLDHIRGYVGQGRSYSTWMHAARALADTHAAAFPRHGVDQWLAMAKRFMTLTSVGRIVFDYDMKIAEVVLAADPEAPVPELWPGIDALAGRPVLLLRGALSQLLSPATLAEMARRLPEAEAVTVADVGHAPELDEPEAVAAIDRLLARVAAR